MNNISGFIQPSMYGQPNVVSIMPQPMSVPIISSGSRSDIMTIVVVSAVVVIFLFILYRNMSQSSIIDGEDIDTYKKDKEQFDDMDPLTKCGWEVRVTETCPYCIQQRSILKEHFPGFKNIYTDRPSEVVPMWINNKTGESIPGMQNYEKLLIMSKKC